MKLKKIPAWCIGGVLAAVIFPILLLIYNFIKFFIINPNWDKSWFVGWFVTGMNLFYIPVVLLGVVIGLIIGALKNKK